MLSDTSRIISKWCSKLWHLSNDYNIFIIYTPRVNNFAPRNSYSTGVTHCNRHVFTVQATDIVRSFHQTEAGLLNKSSCLAPALGVTKFIIVKYIILIILCRAT
jgi:hypothetical protein